MLEIKEIPTISVKRAVSPDGRVNSISFFLQIPVSDPAAVDTERLNQYIELLNKLAEEWQAKALAPAPAHVHTPAQTNGQTPAQANAQTPAPANEENGEETQAVATRIRFVDKVPSKFDPNGQYRIKFTEAIPPLYVSLDRISDILADFKVPTPDRLKGLPVLARVDQSGRVRRISPIRG